MDTETKDFTDVEFLAITLTSKNYIIVGTKNNGLYISKDYGNTWENIGLKNITIFSLCVDSNDYIYVGTEKHGIFKSKKKF